MNDLTIWCIYHDNSQIYKYNLNYLPNYIKLFNTNDLTINGDNINYLNKYLCELTVFYYVWKNQIKSEYVGFCHYRRFFKKISIDNLNKYGVHYYGYLPYTNEKLCYNDIYKNANDKLYQYLKSLNIFDNKLLDDFFCNDKILYIPFRLSYVFTWEMFNKFCEITFGFLEFILPNFKDSKNYLNTDRYYAWQFELVCGVIVSLLSNNIECSSTTWCINNDTAFLTNSNDINKIILWCQKNNRLYLPLYILSNINKESLPHIENLRLIKNESEIIEHNIVKLSINEYIKCKDYESFLVNNYTIETINYE